MSTATATPARKTARKTTRKTGSPKSKAKALPDSAALLSDPWSVKVTGVSDPKEAQKHLAAIAEKMTPDQRKVAERESKAFADASNAAHGSLAAYGEALADLQEKTVSVRERLVTAGKALADAGLTGKQIRVLLTLWVTSAGFSAATVRKAMAALGKDDPRIGKRRYALEKKADKDVGSKVAFNVGDKLESVLGETLNFGFGEVKRKDTGKGKGGDKDTGKDTGKDRPVDLAKAFASLKGEKGEKAREIVDALTNAGLVDSVSSLLIQERVNNG